METETPDTIRTCTLNELHAMAKDYGQAVASWQDTPNPGDSVPRDLDWIGVSQVETKDDAADVFRMYCAAAEENNRCFSPAEFWIHAVNERNDSEEAWDVIDDGIEEGFSEEWSDRDLSHFDPDFMLCTDCAMVAANHDYSGLDYALSESEADEKAKAIDSGLETLGPITPISGSDEAFSASECDCCHDGLAGARIGFKALD
jgi:hypothetical protein